MDPNDFYRVIPGEVQANDLAMSPAGIPVEALLIKLSTLSMFMMLFFFSKNRKRLFAHELQDNLSRPGSIIKFNQDYLLVLTQYQPFIGHRDN